MKFLVTGSAGLVGRQILVDLSKDEHTIYSAYHQTKPEIGIPTQLEITSDEKIKKTIEKINPEVIIHLAAMTDVDLCEKDKELALRINAHATKIISEQAAKQIRDWKISEQTQWQGNRIYSKNLGKQTWKF